MARATVKTQVAHVVLRLSLEEAETLKGLLIDEVSWDDSPYGPIAEKLWDVLDALELG